MATGKISSLKDNGFGFITREGEEKDLFFHKNELVEGLSFESLNEGDELTFEVVQGEKGPNAVQVNLA